MVSITVVKVFNKLPGMSAMARVGLGVAVHKAVFDVEAQAKTRAPVDTGALRASIHGEMTGDTEGQVTTGVDYAVFQEYGTRHMPAHPFMTPAAEAVRPSFIAAVEKAVSGLG
jgi:HK97 gp10 family phage protein